MRTESEIKAIITDLERGGEFDALKLRGDKFEQQLYATTEYQLDLVKGLSAEITHPIPLPSHRPSIEARHAVGLLAQSLQFHVEPSGLRKMDERRADKLEVYFAHQALRLIAPVADDTARLQGVAPFAGWWLDLNPFELPTEEGKREAYRKAYDPYKLSLVDWRTLRFMVDDTGRATVAARKVQIPLIRIVETYGGKSEDKTPLEICRMKFPWLRGGSGRDPDSGTLYSDKAELWVVDDGSSISHAVKVRDTFHQVSDGEDVEDYPNPWGRPSLFLITGSFNVDAQRFEHRFEGLLWEMFGSQYNLDVLLSQATSIALTPPKRGQVIPEALALSSFDSDKPVPNVEFKDNTIASLWGPSAEFRSDADVTLKDLINYQVAERNASLLPSVLTNPDEATLKNSTAAAILYAGESANRLLDAARRSKVRAVRDVFRAIIHHQTAYLNKDGQPAEAREATYVRVSGMESVRGKALTDRKGEELELGPEDFEDFDVEMTLEITPVAGTQSQKAAELEYKSQLLGLGLATPQDVMEVAFEDVTGQSKKVEIFRRFQLRKPMAEKMGMLHWVEWMRKHAQIDMSWLLMATPEMQGAPGVPPSAVGGMGGQRTDPPAMAVPDVGAAV